MVDAKFPGDRTPDDGHGPVPVGWPRATVGHQPDTLVRRGPAGRPSVGQQEIQGRRFDVPVVRLADVRLQMVLPHGPATGPAQPVAAQTFQQLRLDRCNPLALKFLIHLNRFAMILIEIIKNFRDF